MRLGALLPKLRTPRPGASRRASLSLFARFLAPATTGARVSQQKRQHITLRARSTMAHDGHAGDGMDIGAEDISRLALEDKALDAGDASGRRGKGGKGKGGGRGGRGGGGGGGGGSQGREVQVSRALSRLLRHQAQNAGIQLDGEGYAPLHKVLAWGPLKSLGVTLQDVQSIVASNDKQRFALKPVVDDGSNSSSSTSASDYLIRANQGHSIKLESSSVLRPFPLPPDPSSSTPSDPSSPPVRVLHGTYFAFWPSILSSGGLRPMGRTHVHCSTGTPEEGVTSGMRRDAELLIEIDVAASAREGGVAWWVSDNGVVLTEGDADGLLSSRFFKKVEGRTADVGVLWEDGKHKSDLPAGLKVRVPHGKGPRGGGGGGGGRGGRGGRGGSKRGGRDRGESGGKGGDE